MVEHTDYPNVRLFTMDITNFDNKWMEHDTSIASDKDSSTGTYLLNIKINTKEMSSFNSFFQNVDYRPLGNFQRCFDVCQLFAYE